MLSTSSISTGAGVACLSGTVDPAWYPAPDEPGVSSTYLSPSADLERTMNVESTGNGSRSVSSCRSSRADGSPSSLGTGVIVFTTPTREPPMRTSLPFTRLAAFGSSAFRS